MMKGFLFTLLVLGAAQFSIAEIICGEDGIICPQQVSTLDARHANAARMPLADKHLTKIFLLLVSIAGPDWHDSRQRLCQRKEHLAQHFQVSYQSLWL